jgi:hypothetical protein
VSESDRNARFWFEKANKKDGPAPAAAPAEEEPDVLDLLTTKGAKGLDELLAKRGFVKKEEAVSLVNSKASQLTSEAQLLKQYPELEDKESEFFKVTAGHYGELKQAGVPEEMAMSLAVERADLQLLRAGKRKTPQQVADDRKAEREQDRLARIAAQGGDRGGRVPADTEEDEELTTHQKHIVQQMGITEEAYKKRAKEGVKVRGGMR